MDESKIIEMGQKAREALLADRQDLFEVIHKKAETLARLEAEKKYASFIGLFQEHV